MAAPTSSPTPGRGLLGLIERLGNLLPDPVFLFIGATVLVVVLSALGSAMGWSVQPVRPRVAMEMVVSASGEPSQQPRVDSAGRPVIELVDAGAPIRPRSLATSDGVYWLIANLVRNFITFAPLGVVLVSMIGIGVAEKTGLFGAAMRYLATIVPRAALTPTVVFLGIMSNTASDAGYIILPPLAAALYAAYGRSPLAGIAAAFAGVSGGFSANLLIASTDALVAPLTERGARVLEPTYTVLATCNWYFLIGSTFVLTLVGWFITDRIVEPRLAGQADADASLAPEPGGLSAKEVRGLKAALVGVVIAVGLIVAMLRIPGAPLHGPMPAPVRPNEAVSLAFPAPEGDFTPTGEPARGQRAVPGRLLVKKDVVLEAAAPDGTRGTFSVGGPGELPGVLNPPPASQPRWSQAIVPFILIGFLIPGLVYGIVTGAIRRPADVTRAFIHSMSSMAPIIAMAFFAAQFIECFKFSHLDAMLANAGGKGLVASGLPRPLMLVGVVLLVMVVNILMSSMSAKWTALAPILVPMLMMAGVSPELTQAAYRVGDSVTNPITPLNAYIIVILAVVQRYRKEAGIGNLIAMMIPYSAGFFVMWVLFLLGWVALGLPLGPGAPLWYAPGAH
ncbi:MAG: AbgT family transporter [Phycisphaerales bacterium]